jgi:hypothetical protein
MTANEKIQAIVNSRNIPNGYHKAILISLSIDQTNQLNQYELMKNAGVGSRNTLIRIIKELEQLGWLNVIRERDEENRFTENIYEVLIPA